MWRVLSNAYISFIVWVFELLMVGLLASCNGFGILSAFFWVLHLTYGQMGAICFRIGGGNGKEWVD